MKVVIQNTASSKDIRSAARLPYARRIATPAMKFIRASFLLWLLLIATLGAVGCATCHPAPPSESNSAEHDGLILIWLGYVPVPIPTHLW